MMGELPLPRESLLAMHYLTESISDYLTQTLQLRLSDIQARGLSIFDQFYANTEKIYEAVHQIFQSILQKVKAAHPRVDYELVRILSFYLLLLQSAMMKTSQGDGGEDFKTSVGTDPRLREVILSLSYFFSQCLQLLQQQPLSVSVENKIFSSLPEEKEGKKIADLFHLVLEVSRVRLIKKTPDSLISFFRDTRRRVT